MITNNTSGLIRHLGHKHCHSYTDVLIDIEDNKLAKTVRENNIKAKNKEINRFFGTSIVQC